MREIKLNESMNDDSFKEKCRKISFEQFDRFVENQKRDNFHPHEAIAIALLYMVSQMPDTKEKHCEKASATDEPDGQKVRKAVDNLFDDLFDSMNNPSTKDFSTEEKEQNSCAFCSGHKKSKQILIDNGATGVYLDAKKKQEMEKGKCSACSRGKIVLRSFEPEETDEVCTDLIFDPKNRTISINNDIAGFIGSMDITYCPMCGRKL